jgi:hypothetical protein
MRRHVQMCSVWCVSTAIDSLSDDIEALRRFALMGEEWG